MKIITLFFLIIGGGSLAVLGDETISVVVGETASLKCSQGTDCGPLHSVKWYRQGKRIALLAETANLARPEGEMASRIQLSLTAATEMKISPVQVDDEGTYRCELTFIQPADHCETVNEVNIRTLIKPSSLTVVDQAGNELKKDSALGGLLEGSESTVECRAKGGKPYPTLTWTIGDKEVSGDVSTVGEGEDAMTTNRLLIMVERKFQRQTLKCAVTSEALESPMTYEMQLDLILRPIELTISGVQHHVVEGSKVTLECQAKGARPPAVISWANDTEPLPAENIHTSTEEQEDGTYITLSRIFFWATKWEHSHFFNCEARQLAAPLLQGETPLNASQLLDVHFPPVVSVRPDNITVNETMDVIMHCEYEANPAKLLSVTWILNDAPLDMESQPEHYDGGDTKQQALIIKNTSEFDIGKYQCQLENPVGTSMSPDSVYLDVHYRPEVQLDMDPDTQVVESARQNVTLECDVLRGNPTTLLAVRWYLDQELLKQLPDCNTTDSEEDMCSDIDPSRLLLQEVTRSFHGNYSCQGKTKAGWGDRSNDTELIVYYDPGPAMLVYYPERVIKGQAVKLTCSVEDKGRPHATKFQWHRGTEHISEIITAEWLIENVTLETESNFTCRAINEAGAGPPAVVFIQVLAPPSFINNLTSYTGVMYNSSEISLVCQVECSPLCEVSWLKNGKSIVVNGNERDFYTIVNTPKDSDQNTNRFKSMESELFFNTTNWPNQVLDRLSDNATYTCFSQENGVGPSVNSTTSFGVEFPPENLTVSNKVISVKEDQVPKKVTCMAKAHPMPSFTWLRYNKSAEDEDSSNPSLGNPEVLSHGYTLVLEKGVSREDSGYLVCEASNRHGSVQINTYLNVMYKPECSIIQTEDNTNDDASVLICTSNANPTEVEFEWSLKDENDTIDEEAIKQRGVKSILRLDMVPSIEGPRTFICSANNSVGKSENCTIIVQGSLPWWRWWSRTALLVAAGIGILLLLVLLLCLIILCICRHRRAASKYRSPVPMDERESSAITIQNETSIVQAIVSQSLPGISPRIHLPTSQNYSEKSRLVPLQGQFIVPQGRNGPNINPLANNSNPGRLLADLSQLEASYQASLQARLNARSNLSLNQISEANQSLTYANEVNQKSGPNSVSIESKGPEIPGNNGDNNNDVLANDNEISKLQDASKASADSPLSPAKTANKWPLKPGVLVHVNSNHSLSPKKLGRNVIKVSENDEGQGKQDSNASIQNNRETQGNNLKDFSNLGILERSNAEQSNEATDTQNIQADQSIKFDKDKCKNIMKERNKKKKPGLSNIFKRMSFARKSIKSDEDECLSDDGNTNSSKKVKRTKSNKRALSLVGFSLKDGEVDGPRSRGLRSIFQGPSPVIRPSEGVVTFRRPPKGTEVIQLKTLSANDTVANNSINPNTPETLNTSDQSRGSSNSRKRKKPGQAPANGGADNEGGPIENPGLYENLPFHGLQQAPNKPVQVIQPRVVRALIGQKTPRTPESALEKQLECNPSFTPRILSCAPFSHVPTVPNINVPGLAATETSIGNFLPSTSNQTLNTSPLKRNHFSNDSGVVLKSEMQLFPYGQHCNMYNNKFQQFDVNNLDSLTSNDDEQRFHSLNVRKEERKRNELLFSSMKIVRKRKLDRFYPTTRHKIEYIMVNKNEGILHVNHPKSKEDCLRKTDSVIYANFPGFAYPSVSSPEVGLMGNSFVTDTLNASFQNLTDSIQIYENNPVEASKQLLSNRNDWKTPTPAPRTITSPSIADTPQKKSPKEHHYANLASQIAMQQTINENKTEEFFSQLKIDDLRKKEVKPPDAKEIGFIPIANIPKTLPRKIVKTDDLYANLSTHITEKAKHSQFSSLTFPKRTTKSGILMDKLKESNQDEKKSESGSKVISSRTPSRNHSFNNEVTEKQASKPDILLDNRVIIKSELPKISPSVVDATPKIKTLSAKVKESDIYNPSSTFRFGQHSLSSANTLGIISPDTVQKVKHSTKPIRKHESFSFNQANIKTDSFTKKVAESSKSVGKVIPKQHMLIQPAREPLQIPNLLPKPIPKVHPVQVSLKRSQSSISHKSNSEYRQLYKETAVQEGSLVRAKIRELNLRQPFKPDTDSLIYADADLKDYGPINYKQASIYAQMKKIKDQQKLEFARKDDE